MGAEAELDQVVAAHLARGDAAAAAVATIKTLGPQVLGFLVTNVADRDAAFDVFGHFSEEVWKCIGAFRGESSIRTWSYRVMMSSVHRYRRDPYRRRAEPLASSDASAVAAEVREMTPAYRRTDVKDRFKRLREQLDPDDQALLFLRVDQNLSWQDVAAVMSEGGTPVEAAALRKRFERVKVRLRELAARDGLLES